MATPHNSNIKEKDDRPSVASQMRKDRSLASNRRISNIGKGGGNYPQPSSENGYLALMWLVNVPLSRLSLKIGNLRCHCLELRRTAY